MNRLLSLRDPRYYQIAALGSLATWGIVVLDFGVSVLQVLLTVAVALSTQWLGTRAVGLPRFDPLSPLITSLSLTILLRTDLPALSALAAAIAIGSKFLVRVNGKHIFNPANVAIVTLMMFSDRAWIASGQWGSTTFVAFALCCLGFMVLNRAKRSETTLAFLGFHAALLLGRALWLGDPLSIPLHQLQNGTLLIFSFFMISDPKTTPDAGAGRILFAGIVAVIAYLIQFVLYEPHGPVIALILSSPLVPLIDRLLRGKHYQWSRPSRHSRNPIKGVYSCES